MSPPAMNAYDQHPVPNSGANSVMDFNVFEQLSTGYAMPVFGNDSGLTRSSPSTVDENFLNMLFNTNGIDLNNPSPPEPDPEPFENTPPPNIPLPKLEMDGSMNERKLPSLANGLDINIRESMISEKKQRRLVDLVQGFNAIEHESGRRIKDDIFAGSPSDSDHSMSLEMLKTYITCYWLHIHMQMPILHRPTFNPETCPDLLLLAMMCLGATCLEHIHPLDTAQSSAEWAFFVAYHIRWEVFKDVEFRPAAKLWTFQSMLLLELFEKMYSTRSLHERAHIRKSFNSCSRRSC